MTAPPLDAGSPPLGGGVPPLAVGACDPFPPPEAVVVAEDWEVWPVDGSRFGNTKIRNARTGTPTSMPATDGDTQEALTLRVLSIWNLRHRLLLHALALRFGCRRLVLQALALRLGRLRRRLLLQVLALGLGRLRRRLLLKALALGLGRVLLLPCRSRQGRCRQPDVPGVRLVDLVRDRERVPASGHRRADHP